MKKIYLKIYVTTFLILPVLIYAQETNYWFGNFGAISSLKGGIESGGVSNAAAIYYNPGALAFMDGEIFDGQADVISFDILNIKNAGGENVDLNLLQLDIAPSIFVYSKRFKKNNKLGYAIGALTRYNSNISFDLQHEEIGDYLLPNDQKDIFQGRFQYSNRLREGWVMGALSYRVNNKIGIGLGTNFFVRTQDYTKSYKAKAFPQDELGLEDQFSKITSNDEEQKLNYRVLGFIFKPAINFDLSPLKLGITITTPALSLGLLNNDSNSSQLSLLPDEDQNIYSESNSHSSYKGVYKTPLSVSIGAEYQFNKISLAFSTEWFSRINKYNLIKKKNNSEDIKFPNTNDPNFAIPVMANKSIVNFGFSVVYNIKKSLKYIGSLRTDFNFFDDSVLNRNDDFVPNMTYWDVYHITSGIVMSIKKTDITFGVNYGYGQSKNDNQFVDMTSASQNNFLRGNINTNTSTQYHNISFTIGLNLNLSKEKK